MAVTVGTPAEFAMRQAGPVPMPFARSIRRHLLATLAAAALVASTGLHADTIHLNHGGVLEGRVLDENAERVQIRTLVGVVAVPADAVVRIERGPSVFDEYDLKLRECGPTADARFGLGRWCDERGLHATAREHFREVLALDANHAGARAALGFIRVGDAWVDGRRATAQAAASQPAEEDPEQLIAAIQSQWFRRIRAIRDNLLDGGIDRLIRSGRSKIVEIRDPLAILPLTRVLSDGNLVAREALVTALSAFREDEATLNLALLALADADADIRSMALTELVKRDDPRVVSQFRKALVSDSDTLIRRAAIGLGALRSRAAVPDLIPALMARRRKEIEVPASNYFQTYPVVFDQSTAVVLGDSHIVRHAPQIGFAAAGSYVFPTTRYETQEVTVYRTEVLEALRRITDQTFGFDEAAWRRWHEEQLP